MLCVKKTLHKSKTKVSKSSPKPFPRYDGYRLHRNPKGNGWVFVEGNKVKGRNWLFTKADERSLNACVARRGLARSMRGPKNA